MIRARGIVLVVVHLYLVKVLARITHEQGLSLLYCLTPLLSLGIKISDSYKQDPRMTNNIYEMVSGLIFGLLSTVDEFGPTTLRELPLYIQQSKQIETIIRPFIALLMLCYLLYGGVSGWFEVFSMAWPELAKLFALSITLAGLYLYVDPSATETTLISVFFVCFLTAVDRLSTLADHTDLHETRQTESDCALPACYSHLLELGGFPTQPPSTWCVR